MASVECLQAAVGQLVVKRQALHEGEAGRDELESNRLQLVNLQQQVSRALIDRYNRHLEREAA
jgi:hypothetical protein